MISSNRDSKTPSRRPRLIGTTPTKWCEPAACEGPGNACWPSSSRWSDRTAFSTPNMSIWLGCLRDSKEPYPEGLFQLAVRIDSDGMQHYQKFRDVKRFLEPYAKQEALYLRPISVGDPDDARVKPAVDKIRLALAALGEGLPDRSRTGRHAHRQCPDHGGARGHA